MTWVEAFSLCEVFFLNANWLFYAAFSVFSLWVSARHALANQG